jgi:hypothetical protein
MSRENLRVCATAQNNEYHFYKHVSEMPFEGVSATLGLEMWLKSNVY